MFSNKIGDINILGVILDDELAGALKWESKPNLVHNLYEKIVDIFTLSIFRYYMS